MRVEILVRRRQRMPIVPPAVAVVVTLPRHEVVGMMLQLGANLRMVFEVLIEARMRGEELRIVHQPRIARELLCHFGMLVEVAVVEAADFTLRDSVAAAVAVVAAPFVTHEMVRMLLQILPDFRMLRQVTVEARMR